MRHDKVGSVMTRDVVRAGATTPFKEVVRLLSEHRVSGLPVVDDERVVGVLSETDLMMHQARSPVPYEPARHARLAALTPGVRRQAAKAGARTAGQLMTAPPVTAHADDTVVAAARLMAQRRVERLPVLDEEGRLVGIVTRGDLLTVFLRSDEEIHRTVVEQVLGKALWLTPRTIGVSVSDGVVTLDGRMERESDTEIAVSMTRRLDGVVDVVDRLTHRLDDSRLRPDAAAPSWRTIAPRQRRHR
ncbi:CBS domain-containing protein [Streptomyces sp. CRN 30]|uniref:CBS domain-containing protein n=1 Tax=Streptomyces sp. CRN 30 TaxID=3075613 RepID=UPI002A813B17|nr:CBS domain-containing protein [Streptomyces sp. CRN 30]